MQVNQFVSPLREEEWTVELMARGQWRVLGDRLRLANGRYEVNIRKKTSPKKQN